MNRIFVAFTFVVLFLSGCAEITKPSVQIVKVTAQANGQELSGVTCELKNNNGQWTIKAPGQLNIFGAFDELLVTCKKEGLSDGVARVESRYKGNVYRDVLGGRGLVAFLDHTSGAAYEYPSELTIIMGNNTQRISAPAASAHSSANPAPAVPAPSSISTPSTEAPNLAQIPNSPSSAAPAMVPKMSLDAAVKKCAELGFVPGTETSGLCALKLSK